MSAQEENQIELAAELECAVCVEYMHPPIPQCVLGHSMCNSCFRRSECCPICRQAKGAQRNYTLERLHDKMEFPCRGLEYGCQFRDLGAYIQEHEAICSYGKGMCPLFHTGTCQWVGRPEDIVAHCKQAHSVETSAC